MKPPDSTFDPESLIARYPAQESDLRILFARIDELVLDERQIVYGTLMRYDEEARKKSYRIEPEGLVHLIQDQRLLNGTEELLELGPGPGDLLKRLAILHPDVQISGIELSPGFVQNFTDDNALPNAGMRVGMIDVPLVGITPDNRTGGISVLTLDRLSDPREMIRQMGRLNRTRIIGTILPIVPMDDDASRKAEGRVYTSPEKRIVPGRNPAQDREELWKLLKREWKKPVQNETVKYGIYSSKGDYHPYDLDVFFTS